VDNYTCGFREEPKEIPRGESFSGTQRREGETQKILAVSLCCVILVIALGFIMHIFF
jgi:hypothetical protein